MRLTEFRKYTFLIFIGFLAGAVAGSHYVPQAGAGTTDYQSHVKFFLQVLELVRENYVLPVGYTKLFDGALSGMLRGLDSHSSYLTPRMYQRLKSQSRGSFAGLGIEITVADKILTVVAPFEGTPAFEAGIRSRDKIVKIDGKSTRNMTILEAAEKLRGPAGSAVTLTIERPGSTGYQDLKIVRKEIRIRSVRSKILDGNVAYVRLTRFQKSTNAELMETLKELGKKVSISGMVLDLRDNPGGLLDQAVLVANQFLDSGLIVYTQGRMKEQRVNFRATRSTTRLNFKLAVLINGGSASASEVLAGCLQDHNRALLLGARSFGKGSVQTIIPLEEGSALRLTTAYYYTPNGRNIHEKGIVPDAEISSRVPDKPSVISRWKGSGRKIIDPENDPVVRAALKWLKSDESVKSARLAAKGK